MSEDAATTKVDPMAGAEVEAMEPLAEATVKVTEKETTADEVAERVNEAEVNDVVDYSAEWRDVSRRQDLITLSAALIARGERNCKEIADEAVRMLDEIDKK